MQFHHKRAAAFTASKLQNLPKKVYQSVFSDTHRMKVSNPPPHCVAPRLTSRVCIFRFAAVRPRDRFAVAETFIPNRNGPFLTRNVEENH